MFLSSVVHARGMLQYIASFMSSAPEGHAIKLFKAYKCAIVDAAAMMCPGPICGLTSLHEAALAS